MNRSRLFVAVFPPSGIARTLGEYLDRLRAAAPGVAWVKPANLHLTLRFLGDPDEGQVEAAGVCVVQVAGRHAPLALSLHGAGAFPGLDHPRVIWLGVEQGRGALVALAADLERALEGAGLGRAEKIFTAHLTLGRVKSAIPPGVLPALLASLPPPSCSFVTSEICLVRSQLQAGGSRYEPILVGPMNAVPGG